VTQSLSIAAGRGVFLLGRVQTLMLVMICKWFLENRNFTPVSFWQVKVQTGKAGVSFAAISWKKYDSKDVADAIFQKLQEQKMLCVQSVEKKEVNQEPPLLYNLTAL
jgi:DNA topoisomerase-3